MQGNYAGEPPVLEGPDYSYYGIESSDEYILFVTVD